MSSTPDSAAAEPREQHENPNAAKPSQSPEPNGDSQPQHHLPGTVHDDQNASSEKRNNDPIEKKDSMRSPTEVKVKEEGHTSTVQHYDVDLDDLFEIVERKDLDKLNTKYGGISGLTGILSSHSEKGVDSASVDKRREQFGINELNKKDPVTFMEFLVEAFGDPIIQMLCVAAVISIIFGLTLPNPHSGKVDRATGWIEGVAICISVAVVTLMGSVNNYQKAKKFEEMEAEQAYGEVQVFRDGDEITIMSNELVVGDLMVVEGGIKLSCDYLFIAGSDLKCNESAMTGEPDIIEKSPTGDPFFLSGTQLEEGSGRLMVIGVGMNSYQGKMKEATDEEVGDTPLQEHLGALSDDIGKLGFIGAFLLVAALYIKEGVQIGQGDKEANAANFLNYIIIAVTIIVVAIPEGLPLAVTISLAFSMKAMMKDQCMVRVLSSCETMGAATAICSDKTGTLTTNEMTVVQGLIAQEEFVIDGYGIHLRNSSVHSVNREKVKDQLTTQKEVLDKFCFAMSINSTAREQVIDHQLTWVGNKTEHGLLGFVNIAGRSYKEMRDSVAEDNVRQYPFNSKKKRMTTIVKDDFGAATLYLKGASEIILENCNRYINSTGDVVRLDDEKKEEFMNIINDMANQGNRTIGVAYCDYDGLEGGKPFPEEEPDEDTIFMGVMGIQDPIREEVPSAVLNCQTAGVIVRMVTGDNINTAIAISKKCNIYSENGWDHAMTGVEFREMYKENKPALLEVVPKLRVLARSSPQDKYILVGLLQEIGEVVGVTGDGTNDAPALKLANVGFAMQIGTDIAKGASDMILIDNNFATVVKAIKWGRAVNDNIRKFLQYQLSINVGGVVLTIVGALASPTSKEPFAPVQLLWLNLIMDTMAALALSTEKPEDACLTRLPVFKQAALISPMMWSFILTHAGFQTALTLAILFAGHNWFDTVEARDLCNQAYPAVATNESVFNSTTNETTYVIGSEEASTTVYCRERCEHEGGVLDGFRCQQGRIHSTIIFNTFIWFQIFNILNARKLYHEWNPLEGLFDRSRMLCGVFWIIVAFQVFAVEVGDRFLETHALEWDHWLICIGLGACEIVVGAVVRVLPVRNPIPPDVQEKWDKEDKLREAAGVAARSHTHESEHHHSRDPALRRRQSVRKDK